MPWHPGHDRMTLDQYGRDGANRIPDSGVRKSIENADKFRVETERTPPGPGSLQSTVALLEKSGKTNRHIRETRCESAR
jgi:hypothetical protein